MERIPNLGQRAARVLAATLLVAVVVPVVANASDVSSVIPFLLKSGEMGGFEPGKAQVFRTVSAVRSAAGERPSKPQVRRYEAEGFVEAAIVRIHGQAEPAARGISSVFGFETPTGAEAEMRAELKEEFDLEAPQPGGINVLTPRRFEIPGVPKSVAFAFVTNKAAARLGVESGTAKGLFIEGNCLLAVGIFRPMSKEVTEPVVNGVQAIFSRTGGICP
jgi:hypothetical protein